MRGLSGFKNLTGLYNTLTIITLFLYSKHKTTNAKAPIRAKKLG